MAQPPGSASAALQGRAVCSTAGGCVVQSRGRRCRQWMVQAARNATYDAELQAVRAGGARCRGQCPAPQAVPGAPVDAQHWGRAWCRGGYRAQAAQGAGTCVGSRQRDAAGSAQGWQRVALQAAASATERAERCRQRTAQAVPAARGRGGAGSRQCGRRAAPRAAGSAEGRRRTAEVARGAAGRAGAGGARGRGQCPVLRRPLPSVPGAAGR